MLIHSVTPLHMLTPTSDIPQFTHKQLDNCFLEGYDTPQGFQMCRLCSTNPADYLKQEYSPGSYYKG